MAERFPQSQIVPLSGTNNDVYRVTDGDGSVVVKLVTDGDIPLDYLVEVNQVVARRLPTQAVREIHEACDEEPFDVVVAEYIDGVDLAAVLGGDAACSFDRAAIASFLVDFLEVMLDVPPAASRIRALQAQGADIRDPQGVHRALRPPLLEPITVVLRRSVSSARSTSGSTAGSPPRQSKIRPSAWWQSMRT